MPLDLQHATDADLLACFAAGRDQRAFAEIVRRHGPMVMAVATRLLGNRHDAEDAFQAAFLALAKATDKLRRRAAVAAWLHRTTVRAARSIQRMNTRWKRNVQEQSQRARTVETPRSRHELRELLDVELAKLPPKLRSAVVLCDLEGLSRNEAAQRLGVTASTLRNHVAEGRAKLRSRLLKRGVGLLAAGLAHHLASCAQATGCLDATLASTTSTKAALFAAGKSAAEIGVSTAVAEAAQGVITAMTVTKFSMIGAAALAIVFGATAIDGVNGVFSSIVRAETIFFDDFDDGDFADGTPVTWSAGPMFPGDYDASSEDLVLSPATDSPEFLVLQVLEVDLVDTSVRSQGRVRASGDSIIVTARNQSPGDSQHYFGGVGYFEDQGGTLVFAGRNDPGTSRTFFGPNLLLPFDVRQEDAVVQLDVIGNEISVWGWRAGEPRPQSPQFRAIDNQFDSGFVRIAAGYGGGNSAGTFRYIHVADTSIPEPSTALLSAIFFAGVFAWQWRRSR